MNTDQPQDRPIDADRAQATLRTMSDSELADLHAQTPDALKPGAWEVVDQEMRRRARVRLRQGMTPPLSEEQFHEERYPAIRINVVLLKVLAIVVLLACVLGALISLKIGQGLSALVFLVVGFLGAVSYWAGAELLLVLLDIEANTRVLRDKTTNTASRP